MQTQTHCRVSYSLTVSDSQLQGAFVTERCNRFQLAVG